MKAVLTVAGILALLVPAAALGDDPPGQATSPAQLCRQERDTMGTALFRQTYGTNAKKSNAFGKCVSKKAHEAQADHTNAAKQCRAEQADPNFATSHGGKTFQQFYGTNKNGKNSFGKCVSSKAQEDAAEQSEATINAAKKCKAERAADPAAFKNTYGTNKKKSNAFGKCVSKHAKSD